MRQPLLKVTLLVGAATLRVSGLRSQGTANPPGAAERRNVPVAGKSNMSTVASGSLFEAFEVLRMAEKRSEQNAAIKDLFLSQDEEMSSVAKAIQVVVDELKAKPFIIVSEQRSGTELLSEKLNSHPEIMCVGEYFTTHHTDLESAYLDMLKDVKDKPRLQWIGFTLMLGQIRHKWVTDLLDSHVQPWPHVIMHWRRNVLRRMISDQANGHDIEAHGEKHKSHATSANVAQQLAGYKPSIDTKRLIHDIEGSLLERGRRCRNFRWIGFPQCPHSHFEEWATPAHEAEAVRSITSCLHVDPSVTLVAKVKPIRAQIPILDTVANPAEVRATLVGTPYAYLLEEEADEEANFESLKRSDVLIANRELPGYEPSTPDFGM